MKEFIDSYMGINSTKPALSSEDQFFLVKKCFFLQK